VYPVRQLHEELLQCCQSSQVLVHEPQCDGSRVMSEQSVPQAVDDPGHVPDVSVVSGVEPVSVPVSVPVSNTLVSGGGLVSSTEVSVGTDVSGATEVSGGTEVSRGTDVSPGTEVSVTVVSSGVDVSVVVSSPVASIFAESSELSLLVPPVSAVAESPPGTAGTRSSVEIASEHASGARAHNARPLSTA
jgi:hypothetical protein